jgi:hypothetical protein
MRFDFDEILCQSIAKGLFRCTIEFWFCNSAKKMLAMCSRLFGCGIFIARDVTIDL